MTRRDGGSIVEPSWLDAEEMRIWRAFLAAGSLVAERVGASIKARTGLTFEDYEVLVHLSEAADRRLRMTELSRSLLHSQSRLTQRVNRLAERGLVVREKCPEDRRGTYAVLTPAGSEVVEVMAPIHLEDVREALIDRIAPAERAAVAAALERVVASCRHLGDEG